MKLFLSFRIIELAINCSFYCLLCFFSLIILSFLENITSFVVLFPIIQIKLSLFIDSHLIYTQFIHKNQSISLVITNKQRSFLFPSLFLYSAFNYAHKICWVHQTHSAKFLSFLCKNSEILWNCWSTQHWKVYPIQCTNKNATSWSGELSLLHHRAQ